MSDREPKPERWPTPLRPRWFIPILVVAAVAASAAALLTALARSWSPEELLVEARRVTPVGWQVTERYVQEGAWFGALESRKATLKAAPTSALPTAAAVRTVQRHAATERCRLQHGEVQLGYPYLTGRCNGADIEVNFQREFRSDGTLDDTRITSVSVRAMNASQTSSAFQAGALVFSLIALPTLLVPRRLQQQ